MPITSRIAAALLLVAFTQPARAAEGSASAEARTEEIIQRGIALRRAGNDEAALALFLDLDESVRESVRVLLHVTAAAQATGRWMMAHEYLQKALTHKNDPYFIRHRAAIQVVEDAIAQRVGTFRVLGSPAGAEVRLNGQLIGTLPMDGVQAVEVGSYVLEVNKPGYYPLRRPVSVTAGGSLTQEAVDLRERAQAGSVAGATSDSGAARAGAEPTESRSGWQARWITWTLAGTSAAAAATSAVAFAIRQSKAEHWNDESRCLDPARPDRTREEACGSVREDIKLAESVGVGAGIAAVTFGGAALVHWLATGSRTTHAAAGSPRARATCSPGLGSIACYGSF